jgi:hypothetical protein
MHRTKMFSFMGSNQVVWISQRVTQPLQNTNISLRRPTNCCIQTFIKVFGTPPAFGSEAPMRNRSLLPYLPPCPPPRAPAPPVLLLLLLWRLALSDQARRPLATHGRGGTTTASPASTLPPTHRRSPANPASNLLHPKITGVPRRHHPQQPKEP